MYIANWREESSQTALDIVNLNVLPLEDCKSRPLYLYNSVQYSTLVWLDMPFWWPGRGKCGQGLTVVPINARVHKSSQCLPF